MILEFTPPESELHLAVHVGILRGIWSLRRGYKGRYGCEDNGFTSHINGAIGEMVLAKHLKVYWSGTVGELDAPDVAGGYQVRATEHANGRLIVHKPGGERGDNPNQPFVLARILLPEVHLVGWLWGSEAQQERFWRKDWKRPTYLAWPVHDMDTLPSVDEILARGL